MVLSYPYYTVILLRIINLSKLLSFNELKTLGVKYSKSHLYYLMSRGLFPKPLNLSANTVAWIREDIENWVNEKIALHQAKQSE